MGLLSLLVYFPSICTWNKAFDHLGNPSLQVSQNLRLMCTINICSAVASSSAKMQNTHILLDWVASIELYLHLQWMAFEKQQRLHCSLHRDDRQAALSAMSLCGDGAVQAHAVWNPR